MPVSSEKGKELIYNWFSEKNDIKTIVDLGCGSGTYPKLLGDGYVWKGVEIFAPYVAQFNLNKLYKELIIGDIQNVNLPKGDCCIAGDVLEHIEKEGAINTFNKIDKQFKHVVVSMPINSDSQCTANDNQHERHISVWSWQDMLDMMGHFKIKKNYKTMGIFIK